MSNDSPIYRDIIYIIQRLPERPRQVILWRFGLLNGQPQTLNHIGQKYSITRERVRQVQNNTLETLRKSKDVQRLRPYLKVLKNVFDEYGQVMAEKHVVHVASKRLNLQSKNNQVIKRPCVVFLLSLGAEFKESKPSQEFNKFWYLEQGADKKAKKIVKRFVKEIKTKQDLMQKQDLYSTLERIIEKDLGRQLSTNELQALLNLTRELKKNALNLWGYKKWPEVTPKNSGDFAYLAILAHGKPLHFNDIPKQVKDKGIYGQDLYVPTVHNVLIKDPRFVLIGKGKYALSKWGYEPGTVDDLIRNTLKKKGPMPRENLIKEILSQREVKRNTIILNINRDPEVEENDGEVKLKKEK